MARFQVPAGFGEPIKVDVYTEPPQCVPGRVRINANRIWVLGRDLAFRVFDQVGKYLYTVKAPDAKNRSFISTNIEFDTMGRAWVACAETHCVLDYNRMES